LFDGDDFCDCFILDSGITSWRAQRGIPNSNGSAFFRVAPQDFDGMQSVEKLKEWEDGTNQPTNQPTIRQAQKLAKAYKRPFVIPLKGFKENTCIYRCDDQKLQMSLFPDQ